MYNQSEDESNLPPDYQFILNNLSILITDVNFRNITKHFPDLKNVSLMQQNQIINLRRHILRDIEIKPHNIVLFSNSQWERITKYVKEEQKTTI
jgi:hypothetical protein